MNYRTVLSVLKVAIVSVLLATQRSTGTALSDLAGSGGTFAQPLLERWNAEVATQFGGVKVDFEGVGSRRGLTDLAEGRVDFAIVDGAPTKQQIETLGGEAKLVVVPICVGGLVPAYNVPSVKADLRFSGDILADVYLGRIKRWNDARMVKLNPKANLPDLDIVPVFETSAGGNNKVFSEYLTDESADFGKAVGEGVAVKWPVGRGGKGCGGVAQNVQQTEGAVGYLELNYATRNQIRFGAMRNAAGNFVLASPGSLAGASEAAVGELHGSLMIGDLLNRGGDDVYPIASFTYIVVQADQKGLRTKPKAEALGRYLRWITSEGQARNVELGYGPLGGTLRKRVGQVIADVKW